MSEVSTLRKAVEQTRKALLRKIVKGIQDVKQTLDAYFELTPERNRCESWEHELYWDIEAALVYQAEEE